MSDSISGLSFLSFRHVTWNLSSARQPLLKKKNLFIKKYKKGPKSKEKHQIGKTHAHKNRPHDGKAIDVNFNNSQGDHEWVFQI